MINIINVINIINIINIIIIIIIITWGMRPGGRNLELTGAWRLEAAGWAGSARVEAGAGAASSLVVSAGSEGAGASWGTATQMIMR